MGCSRKNITEIVKNNPHLFKGVSITSTLSTEGGPQKAVCLNRDGVIGILMRVHPSGSKTEDGKRKIEKFQEWARDTLSREMRIQQAQAPAGPVGQPHKAWADPAGEHIRFAKTIARELGMPENWCLTVAIQQAEKETGINLSQYRKLIAPVQAPDPAGPQAPAGAVGPADPAAGTRAAPLPPGQDYLTVSEIARIVRMRSEEINRYLTSTGYQYRDDTGQYYLTEKGGPYGSVFPYCAGSGHSGTFLKWKKEIISASRMIENRPARIQ